MQALQELELASTVAYAARQGHQRIHVRRDQALRLYRTGMSVCRTRVRTLGGASLPSAQATLGPARLGGGGLDHFFVMR